MRTFLGHFAADIIYGALHSQPSAVSEDIMAATRRCTYTVYLCTLFLLLSALTAVSAAGDQQKLADAIEAATTRDARFFNKWAVGVNGGPENADKLARKHGLTNRGQVS